MDRGGANSDRVRRVVFGSWTTKYKFLLLNCLKALSPSSSPTLKAQRSGKKLSAPPFMFEYKINNLSSYNHSRTGMGPRTGWS